MSVSPDWSWFRAAMPVAPRWAYFDHAAVAPLSGPALDVLTAWAHEAAAEGDSRWPDWSRQVEELRASAGRLIGASAEEIALVRNTTAGINCVAEGFPWQSGDNVVFLADEFPSNQYPWLHLQDYGVEPRAVPVDGGRVDYQRLADACDGRTRIVSLSWVGYASGWRNDLDRVAEIAHRRGALLFVDAIQALGVFPLDVRQTPVDFLAADGHKWLLGPEGAGVFYCRQEHLDRLRTTGVGWSSVAAGDFTRIDLTFKSSAARFEGGSQNIAGMLALKASLELLMSFGAAAIGQRLVEITDLCCERLAAAGASVWSDRRPAVASGIVSFDLPGRDPQEVRRRCFQQQVALSCRGGRLRISPHAYVNADDVERLIAALR